MQPPTLPHLLFSQRVSNNLELTKLEKLDLGAVYILYSKVLTDPGLLKIRHSHRFVAVVIQVFNSIYWTTDRENLGTSLCGLTKGEMAASRFE